MDSLTIEYEPQNPGEIINSQADISLATKTLSYLPKIPLKKGGAVFFDSFVPHRSSTNKSSRPRRALYVTYNAKTEGDLRKDYYDFKKNSLKDGYVSLIGHFEGEAIK